LSYGLESDAVFVNQDRRAVLSAVAPDVPSVIIRAQSERTTERDLVRENVVQLETLIRLATGPNGETSDQAQARAAQFDHEMERLLDVLSNGTGVEMPPAVPMSGLRIAEASATVNGGYVHVRPGQEVESARNSIVVIEPGGWIGTAENCIVVVPRYANFGTLRNSIALGRYKICPHAGISSVVLSEFDVVFVHATDCVCGGRRVSSEQGILHSVFANVPDQRGTPVQGLELTPAVDHSLDGVIDLTGAFNRQQGIALFRTKDGKGEYVARFGQPVLTPDGRPITALDGWRLEYASTWKEYAVFVKDGRYAVLQTSSQGP